MSHEVPVIRICHGQIPFNGTGKCFTPDGVAKVEVVDKGGMAVIVTLNAEQVSALRDLLACI